MTNITEKIKLSLSKRQRSEKRFKFLGFIGISFAILFLIIILYSIFSQGLSPRAPKIKCDSLKVK